MSSLVADIQSGKFTKAGCGVNVTTKLQSKDEFGVRLYTDHGTAKTTAI